MFCKNCGKELKDTAKFCAQCGYRVTESDTAASEQPVVEQPMVVQPVIEQPMVEQPVMQPPVIEQPMIQQPIMAPPVKKSRAKFRIKLGIAAGIVLVLVVVAVINASAIVNFAKKTFSSPAEYYQWVEGKNLKDAAALTGSMYDDSVGSLLNLFDTSISGEIGIELAEVGKESLSTATGLAGVDMSWFEKGSMSFSGNIRDLLMNGEVALKLGDKRILSAETIIDLENLAIYLGIPSISDSYLEMDYDTAQRVRRDEFARHYDGDDLDSYLPPVSDKEEIVEKVQQLIETLDLLKKNMPDNKDIQKLVEKYGGIVLAGFDDVKMTKGRKLRAEGITESCTELKVTVTNRQLYEILRNFISELKEDEDLRDMVFEVYEAVQSSPLADESLIQEDASEGYAEFLEDLIELENRLERGYSSVNDDVIMIMNVYVDGDGDIHGRSFEIMEEYSPFGYDSFSFSVKMPHKGSEFGFSTSIEYDGDIYAITGTGNENGKSLDGEFSFDYNGASIFTVTVEDFKTRQLRTSGYVNGTFTLKPSTGIMQLLDSYAASSALNYEAEVKTVMDSGEAEVSITLKQDGEPLGTLFVNSTRGSSNKVSTPSDKYAIMLDSPNALIDYWDTIEWDDFLQTLEDAQLPSKWIDMVEKLAESNPVKALLGETAPGMW